MQYGEFIQFAEPGLLYQVLQIAYLRYLWETILDHPKIRIQDGAQGLQVVQTITKDHGVVVSLGVPDEPPHVRYPYGERVSAEFGITTAHEFPATGRYTLQFPSGPGQGNGFTGSDLRERGDPCAPW